jgi:hypothetical protein
MEQVRSRNATEEKDKGSLRKRKEESNGRFLFFARQHKNPRPGSKEKEVHNEAMFPFDPCSGPQQAG